MSEALRVSRIDLVPLGGIAGDMFAAALFGCFPKLYTHFCNDLDSLAVAGLAAVLEDRMSNSLEAKYFNVVQRTSQKPPRTLATVSDFLDRSSLSKSVVRHATGIFTLLAQAEAEVHGKTIDTIHFHEVSDWDSVVDIVAAAGIIARLDCPLWRVGALPLGGGSVNTAHGDIPVPAPATLALLKGFHWHDDGVAGERVTPTGAAIVAYLQAVPIGAATSSASLFATGSGCGTRELEGRANILRVTAFTEALDHGSTKMADTAAIAGTATLAGIASLADTTQHEVVRIAFEVDDMTAEEIAWAADKLLASEGVLDIARIALQGKKGRAATGFRIIVTPSLAADVINYCFTVTSTIGVRHERVQRVVLSRSEHTVAGIGVKVVSRPQGQVSAKTSSDGLASAGSLPERRKRAEATRVIALQNIESEE